MQLFEHIPLPNGLVAEIYDLSRPIAADTTKVEMVRPGRFSARIFSMNTGWGRVL